MTKVVKFSQSATKLVTESKFFDYQFCGITNIGFKIEKIEKP